MRRHFITIALSGVLAVACGAVRADADAVILKDGTRVEGEVKRTDTGWTVTSSDGKATDVSADDVRTIEVGGGQTTAATAASNLASLERSAEALSSPAQVLERYRRFLDQNKGTPSIDTAKRDMVVWQDRLDRGLVKVGTQWVTTQQKSEMALQANDVAKRAMDLLKQGRTNEAEPIIQQALDADPQNPAALYLRGVILFGQGQEKFGLARKAFEGVIAVLAGHGPSLNNLAVVFWRQNQPMMAMRFYEQGMTALPVNKVVLDNVAEALAALPMDQRGNPLAARVFKLFTEQDEQLQAIMAQTGWHRWGSTWVDQATLDKLKAAEQAVKDEQAKDMADINAAKAKIAGIASSIDANTRAMNQIQQQSLVVDQKGNLYQLPLPATYYSMQSDNEKLTTDRAVAEAKIQSLIEDGKKAQQSLPVPQFTGIQRLIGVEGTPFPPPSPSTIPTTLPTPAPATAPASPPVMMPLP